MAEPYSVLEHEYIGRRDGQGLSIPKLYIECHVWAPLHGNQDVNRFTDLVSELGLG